MARLTPGAQAGVAAPSETRLKIAQRGPVGSEVLRVLLIEDNPADADLLLEHLQQLTTCSVELTCRPRLEEGLRELASQPFDALVTDLQLPDATPRETLSHIKKTRESVAIVVVSGVNDETVRREALRSGAQEFIAKGPTASVLIGPCLLGAVERHRSQANQRQLERWMAAAPDAMIVTNALGRVQFVNLAATQLFGRSEAEFREHELFFALNEGRSAELEILRDGERRFGEMRVTPVDWHGAPALMATIRDNTERRKAEADLAAVDRLVSLGTMAASVAHEINNPLAAMLVNLEIAMGLARAQPELGELGQLLQDARDAAYRVRTIAGDLRTLSRTNDATAELVDVQRVVDSALRFSAHEIRSRARVQVMLEADLPPVLAQESRLGQVLTNLLVNAAQAMPQADPGRNLVRIEARRLPNEQVELAVTDNGSGMSPDVLERLFTPFFTSKPASQGTGLGLSICRRIVDSYGGRIEVESQLGVGTTFRVVLPAGAAAVSAGIRSLSPAARRRGKVLIIDDERMLALALERALKPHHDVELAFSAQEALEAIRRSPHFDIAFCDVTMPAATGTDLYEVVESEFPKLAGRIVFLSGGAYSARVCGVLDRIPNLKLPKPLNLAEISSLIVQSIDSADA